MTTGDTLVGKEKAFTCQRCKGWMGFEKFYGPSDSFFGWRCVLCGNILDPVIFLNRLLRKRGPQIPGERDQIISLIKKYMDAMPEPS